MKRTFSALTIILSVALILQPQIAFAANKIHSIDITVELQADGSAIVQEERHMTVDNGTELYIEMTNLQDSDVTNFSVEGFTYNPVWDSDDSLEEKEGYYGIIQDGEDSELVWGMGEHGQQTYHLTYTLSNVVRQLEDGQALLWNFDTFLGIPTDNMELAIHSPTIRLNQQNTDFWGYGFDGDIQMVANQIIWTAEENLDDDNNVTVLLQFPTNLFDTNVSVDMTLEEQLQMANEGSSYNDSSSLIDTWLPWLIGALVFIPATIISSLILAWYLKLRKVKRQHNAMITGVDRIKKNLNRPNSTIPEYGGDIANVAYLLQELNYGSFEDYFAAYLIKWLSEERIRIETFTSEKFFGDKYTTYIYINDIDQARANSPISFEAWLESEAKNSTIEEGMWLMLLDASDSQGEIDSTVMQLWGKDHVEETKIFDELLTEKSVEYLSGNGYINFVEAKVWGRPVPIAQSTPAGEALFDHIVQHLAYLDSVKVDQIPESDGTITQLIIWSLIGGISTKLNKQFENILPMEDAYNETGTYSTSYYWYSTMHFRQNWSSGLSSGGYNSTVAGSGGSGGSTSSGGGGGAGGGGAGGAR